MEGKWYWGVFEADERFSYGGMRIRRSWLGCARSGASIPRSRKDPNTGIGGKGGNRRRAISVDEVIMKDGAHRVADSEARRRCRTFNVYLPQVYFERDGSSCSFNFSHAL